MELQLNGVIASIPTLRQIAQNAELQGILPVQLDHKTVELLAIPKLIVKGPFKLPFNMCLLIV